MINSYEGKSMSAISGLIQSMGLGWPVTSCLNSKHVVKGLHNVYSFADYYMSVFLFLFLNPLDLLFEKICNGNASDDIITLMYTLCNRYK